MIILPGYDIKEQVYESETTLVFKGWRVSDHLPVVVKMLNMESPGLEEIAGYKHEYQMLSELAGVEGIPHVVALTKENDYWMIILEDKQGQALEYLIHKEGPFSITQFLPIALQLSETLLAIHQRGIIHKDINPSNLLWDPEKKQVQIIDFGIASKFQQEQPQIKNINTLQGTLAYLSPEQTGRMNRRVDQRSDFYSLGVTFYKMLTGQLPFEAEDVLGMVHQHISKLPTPPHEINNKIPEVISNIICKLLAKRAEDRYQTAYGLVYDLERCRDELKLKGVINPFPIGEKDLSDRFQIQQKLYGREEEVKTLLESFESVCLGSRGLAVISGYSGIGKSTLIHEIYKPVVARKGYFIQGKYDLLQRNLPCLAIKQMFQDFIDQILTESPQQLAAWKDKLTKALGENGQILVDLAPEAEKVIGKQSALLELDPIAAENRFLYVIKNIVNVLPHHRHPIVIFLDDMQWIDSISIKLIESWLTQINTGHLLFVFSYRDNEVGETHPLKLLLNRFKSDIPMQSIVLKPLTIDAISALIADGLHTEKAEVQALAELCNQKTGGNPFFLIQFLYLLNKRGIIKFDKEEGRWTWDYGLIKEQSLAENVTELMVSNLKKIAEKERKALSIASCIGNTFDISTLANLLNQSEQITAQDLNIFLQEDYLMPLNDNYRYAEEIERSGAKYKFSHDKIREAAHLLIDEDERKQINLKLARYFNKVTPAESLDNMALVIADYYDHAIDLVTDEAEKQAIIKLNFQAGLKAKSIQSYEQASYYFDVALSLTRESDWESDYAFMLELYSESAAVCGFLADEVKLKKLSKIIFSHAKHPLDTLKLQRVLIFTNLATGKSSVAVQGALKFLKKLGYHFPANPSILRVLFAIIQTRFLARNVTPEKIIHLPLMTDQNLKAIMQVMVDLIPPSFEAKPELAVLLMAKLFRMTIKHGLSEFAPYACLGYSLILTGVLKKFSQGYEYGQTAIQLVRQLQQKEYYAKISVIFYYMIHHTVKPYKECLDPLMESYNTALDVGDYQYAILALVMHNGFEFTMGCHLPAVAEHMENTTRYGKELKHEFELRYHMLEYQNVWNLLEKQENIEDLSGPLYDEKVQLPQFIEHKDVLGVILNYLIKLRISYIFGKYDLVIQYANKIRPHVRKFLSNPHYPVFLFYDSLAHIAIYPTLPWYKKLLRRVHIWKNLRELKYWSTSCQENYLSKYYLVKAEWLRVRGKYRKTIEYYEKSIKLAHQNELLPEEALATELLAKFYFDHYQDRIGKIYYLEAYHLYKKWGSQPKLNLLEEQHPFLKKAVAQPLASAKIISLLTSKTGLHTEALDYASAMKASALVASEIVLPQLIAKLLTVLAENIGAERCVLFLNKSDQLYIEGEFNVSTGITHLMESIPLSAEDANLPKTIVQFVGNKHENVVIDDASQSNQFIHDAYIATVAPKSILAAPILYQGRLLGVLYFENNLLAGAFTEQRLEFLKILSSQIAISIENAKLHHAFEQFVPKQFLELLGKTDLVNVKLGDHIQKNLTILFTDIRDFSTLVEQQNVASVFQLLNDYLSHMEPIITRYNGFIDKFIGDAIMALFPLNADDAVKASIDMQHALQRFNKHHQRTIATGIGVSTGLCMLGTVGSAKRMDGSVISDAVNTASRIEAANKVYGTRLLISEETRVQLHNNANYNLRYVDKVTLKGKTASNILWEVIDSLPADIKAKRMANLATYEKAILTFQAGHFKLAWELFNECLKTDPQDSLIALYKARCESNLHEEASKKDLEASDNQEQN